MENVLMKYDNMSDEELAIANEQITLVRMKKCERKMKEITRDLEKTKIVMEKQKEEIDIIGETLKVTCIDRFQVKNLDDLMINRVRHFVGKNGNPKYTLFFGGYKATLLSSTKKKFGISSIKDLKISDFENAKSYINIWSPNGKITERILNNWKEKIDNEEIKNGQLKAYNSYMDEITLRTLRGIKNNEI